MIMHGGDGSYSTCPMPLHMPQGFQYYRKGVDEDDSPETGPLLARIPHAACAPLSPTYMKDSAEGFPRENCILELRKEKSRDAARSRRGKENYEFYELAKMLPLPSAITTQLDKASIIRLTISYLRLRDFSVHGDPPWTATASNISKSHKGPPGRTRNLELFEEHQGTHILQSLDGFAFALGADGRFLYISETVSIYLGLSQVELTGSSVFDYIHQQDHAELAEQLGLCLSLSTSGQQQSMQPTSPTSVLSDDGPASPASLMTITNSSFKGLDRAFCVRMKSTLTKRGCHFKSSGYRVVLVLCHLRPQYSFANSRSTGNGKQGSGGSGGGGGGGGPPPTVLGLVALAIALPPPSVNEVRLESDMFVTRLTFDFKVAHCEPRIAELLDYTADEFTGKNMYALCHGEDMSKLRKCHVDLIHKGQVMSSYYRLMSKNGGFSWMQTCATVVCNAKNADEQSIICVNYVLSGIEYEHCVMDCCQLPGRGRGRDGGDLEPPPPPLPPPPPPPPPPPSQPPPPPSSSASSSSSSSSTSSGGGGGGGGGGRSNTRSNGDNTGGDYPESESSNEKGTEVSGGGGCDSLSGDGERRSNGGHLTQLMTRCHSHSKQLSARTLDNGLEPLDVVVDRKVLDDDEAGLPRRSRKKRRLNTHEDNKIAAHDLNHTTESAKRSCPSLASSSAAALASESKVASPPPHLCRENRSSRSSAAASPRSCDGEVGERRSVWKYVASGGGGGGSEFSAAGNEETSVKDLEDVVNKHLPMETKHEEDAREHDDEDDDDDDEDACDVDGDDQEKQRPTIQWIGGGAANHGGSPGLPASTLLRQLYANRESVIRSNVHSRPSFFGDLSGNGQSPQETASIFADQQQQQQQQVGGQFVLPAPKLIGHPTDSSFYSSTSATSVAIPVSSYSSDSYNSMTPPSSVSPREKLHPSTAGFIDGTVYGDLRHFGSSGGGVEQSTQQQQPSPSLPLSLPPPPHLQSLPLKPQVYTLEAPFPAHTQQPVDHTAAAAAAAAAASHHQQFYAHHHHHHHHHHHSGGFQVYHPTANKAGNGHAVATPITPSSSSGSSSANSSTNANGMKNGTNSWFSTTDS